MCDLTPLPDLAQRAGLTAPTCARRPVYMDLLPRGIDITEEVGAIATDA